MRKGIIPTVSVDSDQIRKEIKAAGYSIRSLAPEIGVDRRTIMKSPMAKVIFRNAVLTSMLIGGFKKEKGEDSNE